MPMVELRQVVCVFLISALIALLMTVLHVKMVGGRIEVCFDVRAESGGSARVYWDSGAGYTASQSIATRIPADAWTSVCLSNPAMHSIKGIRIDPANQPTRFNLRNPRIVYLVALTPAFSTRALFLAASDVDHDIQRINQGEYLYESTGIDPYFGWSVAATPIAGAWVATLNFAMGLICVLAGFYTAAIVHRRLAGAVAKKFLDGSPIYALYAVFFAFAILSRDYLDLATWASKAWWVCLLLAMMFWFLVFSGKTHARAAVQFAGVGILAFVIAFDVAYRLGIFHKPVFAKVFSNDIYQWKLMRVPADNIVHSSLPYQSDLREIGERIEPGNVFLSDLATSYYISAAMPLYATNVHPHHSRRHGYYFDVIEALCRKESKANEQASVLALLRAKSIESSKAGLTPVRYVFINKDQSNRNVRANCLTQNVETVSAKLRNIGKQVYRGKYIDAYDLLLSRSTHY